MRNRIVRLISEDGSTLDNPESIKHELMSFYKKLLGSNRPKLKGIDKCIVHKVAILTEEHRRILVVPILDKEIDIAMRSIRTKPALGINGINALFFRKI